MTPRTCASCNASAMTETVIGCPRCDVSCCVDCAELHQCPEPAAVAGSEPDPDVARAAAAVEAELRRYRAWFERIVLDCRRCETARAHAAAALHGRSWPDRPSKSNPRGGGR